MTLSQTKTLSKHIFRLLKVTDITFPIGRTSKGNLGITFNANNDDFDIMLDSIPLSTKDALADENNIELKKMIGKYLFEKEATNAFSGIDNLPGEVSHAKPEPKKTTKTK